MQTKNRLLLRTLIVAKGLPLLLVPRHQSKHVTSVSNQVYHAMVAIHVVSINSNAYCDRSSFFLLAKCVQRKCRCTYVKFHRQTAPTGPGHHPRTNPAHSRLPSQPHADDFILGPPPLSVPSMDSYGHTFNFPQMYPSSSDPQLTLNHENGNGGPDFAAKYRAQAELLRRTGHAMTQPNGSGVVPGLYTDPQASTSWFGYPQDGSPDPNNPNGQNGLSAHDQSFQHRYLVDESKPITDKELQSLMSRQHYDRDNGQYSGMPGSHSDIYAHGIPGSVFGRHRSGSLDLGSDSGSASHSVPSSAASSSVHLPLDGSHQQQMGYNVGLDDPQHYQELIPSEQDVGQSQDLQNGQVQYPLQHGLRPSSSHPNLNNEGGFSSAFGLMSIDDPNVMAGLSQDGAPFFSSVAMNLPPQDPNATPMPPKPQRDRSNTFSASLPTPGLARDAETRELRDFWKAYIHTPLTGPAGADQAQSTFQLNQRAPTSPTGPRRVRVNSLPSAKTPTADLAEYLSGNQQNAPAAKNGTSSMRTTLHGNPDDLRSYEAAVLARKAPTLNLVPKKGRGSISATSASPPNPPNRVLNVPNANAMSNGNYSLSRPSSSSSSSSLAFALDQGGSSASHPRSRAGLAPPPGSGFSNSGSRESSVSDEAISDRPSFKRLPSQTLGPTNSKRALLSTDAPDAEDGSLDAGAASNSVNISKSLTGLHGTMNPPSRPIVNLTDRHRRLSNPTALIPSIATYTGAGTQEQGRV